MTNVFSAIGFDVQTEDAFGRAAVEAAERGEGVTVAGGTYLRWAPGAGVELWAQVDPRGAILGLNPHFAGETALTVAVVERIGRDAYGPLEGAFRVWVNPDEDDLESGEFPFVFDAPEFRAHDGARLPALAEVQVAAFARELQAYASEEAYYEAQTSALKLAAESFIPSGMFDFADGAADERAAPLAEAIFGGRVLATEARVNPATGNAFRWIRVRTLGGEVDVVADPALVEGEVVEGGTVSGTFWLSGRLRGLRAPRPTEPAAAVAETAAAAGSARPSFWRRLLGLG